MFRRKYIVGEYIILLMFLVFHLILLLNYTDECLKWDDYISFIFAKRNNTGARDNFVVRLMRINLIFESFYFFTALPIYMSGQGYKKIELVLFNSKIRYIKMYMKSFYFRIIRLILYNILIVYFYRHILGICSNIVDLLSFGIYILLAINIILVFSFISVVLSMRLSRSVISVIIIFLISLMLLIDDNMHYISLIHYANDKQIYPCAAIYTFIILILIFILNKKGNLKWIK